MANPVQDTPAREQFEQGVRTFGRLFTRWMDLNEWSHPKLASLAKAALGGVGWLHSSQISGLRHYPARDAARLEKLHDVIHNRDVWDPGELANELPALAAFTGAMGGPSDEDSLIDELKRKDK